MLEIITTDTIVAFETAITEWLEGCNNGLCDLTAYGCETNCDPVIPVVPAPLL
jgi:hypothetical protein